MKKTMQMSDEPDAYQSYLLRLWRVRCQGEWQWRASLESRHTGEHQAFAGLEQLFAFLGERCEERSCTGGQCPIGAPRTPDTRRAREERKEGGWPESGRS